MDVTERKTCRVCATGLQDVFDFGAQCIGGQFPAAGEPDPPRFPLVLTTCSGCGLLQLRHTVAPELMFRNYWYRSGVTQTMPQHLSEIAREAETVLGRLGGKVLDIGGNDGTLLSFLSDKWQVALVDPSCSVLSNSVIRDFWPSSDKRIKQYGSFDLIFSIACFYDADDPVAFARAVRDNLTDDGVWCCEVADATVMLTGAWDGICHEHLCYYSPVTFANVCDRAGLKIIRTDANGCNGGSLRFWVQKETVKVRRKEDVYHDYPSLKNMPMRIRTCAADIISAIATSGKVVHLLGASTKANTWLQFCNLKVIQYASDRDQRKHGRCTPGTNIPIISEEESRAMKPDVYVVGPWHFRDEIVKREAEFLNRGGKLVFPLPKLEVVG